ncbi:MAG: putative lipid-binding transport protein (Tim44 family) [Myxococcota bacterium]|jgi:predicted lipid-binding transport protein (Tim44 family)
MTPLHLLAPPALAQDIAQDLTNAATTSATYLVGGLVAAVVIGNAVLFMARRSTAKAQEDLEAASRPLELRSPSLVAQLARPKRDVDMDALVDAIPRFSLDRFREWAQALHRKVHEARATRDISEIEDLIRPGALESVFHGPSGLEAVGRIRFVRTRLVRTTVASTGCQIKLRLIAHVDETRSGERQGWEIDETWRFSRENDSWHVLHIEREVRQPCIRPSAAWDKPHIVDLETRRDPEMRTQRDAMSARHADLDWHAFEDGVRQAFARVQAAITHQQPEAVTNLLSPLALEELQTWMRRYHKHGLARKRLDPTIERVEVVRLSRDAEHERVTCRLTGSILDLVEDADGNPIENQRSTPAQFSYYWTFRRKQGGPWRVDFMDDDLTWVV